MLTLREFAKQAKCLGAYMVEKPKKKKKKLAAYLQKKAGSRIITSRSKRLAPRFRIVTSKTKRKY